MNKKVRARPAISFMFSLLVLLTQAITVLLTVLLVVLLTQTGVWQSENRIPILLLVGLISILVGSVFSKLASRRPIKTLEAISSVSMEVAKGNFDVTLAEDAPIKELHVMTQNFNLMVRELDNTEVLRKDFVENVSHEFKTPLSAIEGYATLLQKPDLSEEKRKEYTGKILFNTKRLSSLTGNILLLSQLDSQDMEIQKIHKALFSLDEQLRESILAMEDKWNEKEIDLKIDLDNADYLGNRELLAHVWQNILQNAIKYSPVHGTIQVFLQKKPQVLKVSIADTGPGMSPEVQKRVFEKFYQGDRSRSSEGNGLGLALAKRIVDLHEGIIAVSSKEGEGAAFTVTLPIVSGGDL